MSYLRLLCVAALCGLLMGLAACASTRPKAGYWRGFSGPAYLPGKTSHPPKP